MKRPVLQVALDLLDLPRALQIADEAAIASAIVVIAASAMPGRLRTLRSASLTSSRTFRIVHHPPFGGLAHRWWCRPSAPE